MSTELLTSKLFIPPLRPSRVERPRLINVLNEGLSARRRLTLVSAPAGFGKTTLVVEWIATLTVSPSPMGKGEGVRVAWLSLEEGDNDPRRFLAYLGAAFQHVDEDIGASLRSTLQTPQLAVVEPLLAGLLNEIAARSDPLLLVLDDLHLITESAILQGLEFMLDHQPPQLHIVLTTREDPDLPLARLRARDQLTEVRARELRFTRAEADVFLRGIMGIAISEQDVALLEDRTEGWAAGLQLAGLSMQKQTEPKSFIADFSGSHRHILDYLTDEVLEQQPESLRSFLLQTAILDRLCGPLCDALTQRQDGDSVLARLEAANLFLIPLDEERRWYRYHHLFSDLLRSQLVRTQPDLIPELHRRAACWHEEHGEIQEAIDHALQDRDQALAAGLIERYSLPMLYQGQIARMVSWFDRLPREVFETAPLLCIGQAWALALMQRGSRTDEVERALNAASQALEQVKAGDELRALVSGHEASLRAFLLRGPARTGETREGLIALARQAQQLLPVEEKAIRSMNDLSIGYGYLGLADLTSARRAFEQALEEGLAGSNYYAAIYGPINLILCALLVGRRREALQLCEASLDRFNRILSGQYFPPIGALYILKGHILFEQNQLAEAEQLVTDGLDLIRWTGESVAHRTGYATLARARAIRGDRSGMSQALQMLEETLPKDVFYAQALHHCLLLRHWPQDPQAWSEAGAWLSGEEIEIRELEVIHSLNPASTARFESSLYTIHVLAHLARAMPGVHSLEGAEAYLERQMQVAEAHGIVSWVVMLALARTQLYEAAGKRARALEMLETALRAAAPTGLLRVFLDEGESLGTLLKALRPRLKDASLIAYAGRLSEAFEPRTATPAEKQEALLSGRELEVLQHLAHGLSYEEIGQGLFLSLNTIQSHVKSIYRKLLVNKRVHAIEKAREMKLI